jgi:hypothetical protein
MCIRSKLASSCRITGLAILMLFPFFLRECVVLFGTRFSNIYTAVDTPTQLSFFRPSIDVLIARRERTTIEITSPGASVAKIGLYDLKHVRTTGNSSFINIGLGDLQYIGGTNFPTTSSSVMK